MPARNRCHGGRRRDRRLPSPKDRGSSSTPARPRRWKRWSIASSRPIPTRPAARTPDARSSSIGSSPAPMDARPASMSARRSSRERRSKARRTKTAQPSNTARRWRRSTNIARPQKGGAFASLSDADKDAIIGDLESGAAKLDGVDGQAFFDAAPEKRAGGFFRRPDLRRQSRHVRVAHDRLSRRPLRLS